MIDVCSDYIGPNRSAVESVTILEGDFIALAVQSLDRLELEGRDGGDVLLKFEAAMLPDFWSRTRERVRDGIAGSDEPMKLKEVGNEQLGFGRLASEDMFVRRLCERVRQWKHKSGGLTCEPEPIRIIVSPALESKGKPLSEIAAMPDLGLFADRGRGLIRLVPVEP